MMGDKIQDFLAMYRFIDLADLPEGYQPEDKHKKGVLFMGKVSFLNGYGVTSELNQAINELAEISPVLKLIPYNG